MSLSRLTLPSRLLPVFRRRSEGVAAPVLHSPKRFPYGPFRFQIQLAPGTPFRVQATRELKDWIDIGQGTTQKTSSTIEYVDSEAFKFNHRFYRAIANDVPSQNVIGYASTVLPPGFSMIANPFSGSNQTVEELLTGWPDGTTFSRFDPHLFKLNENKVVHGKWSTPYEKLVPGEGAIFFNPTADYKSVSFAGDVVAGEVSLPLPAGFSIRSALGPVYGDLQKVLACPVADGDVVHLFDRDRQSYMIYEFEGEKWKGDPPVVSLCEAFWIAKTKAANWRTKLEIEE